MKKLTKGLGILLASSLVLGLAACGGGSDDKALSTEKITIGTTAGPHQQIAEEVQKISEKRRILKSKSKHLMIIIHQIQL